MLSRVGAEGLFVTALDVEPTLPTSVGGYGDPAFYQPVEGGHGRLEGPLHGAHHDGDISLPLEPVFKALSQAFALLEALISQ